MSKKNLENEKYWESRSEQIILNSEKEAKDMLKKLKKVYEGAKKDLQKEIYAFYGKYAKETGLTLQEVMKRLVPAELQTAKQDIELYYAEVERLGGYSPQYQSYLKNLSARAYMSRLEELKLQMTKKIEDLYRTENINFSNNLSGLYEESYMRMNFNIQKGFGFSSSFSALDDKIIQKTISQKWAGDNFADRIWSDKEKLLTTLETKFSQGVALGHGAKELAETLSKEFDVKYSNCERLAITEFNHIANQATLDSYKQYSTTPQYKIVATLDSRTSEICREMDGKVFYVKDAKEGVNFPLFHPRCRTTTIPYFEEDEIDKLFEKSKRLAEGGQLIDASVTYKQWKENLVEIDGKMVYKEK